MRDLRLVVWLLCLLILGWFAPCASAQSDISVPEPEQYLNDGHYSQYVKAVADYLAAGGDSPAASRVEMDLLMAAAANGDSATVEKMRQRIVMEHTTSIQAKYIINALPDANAFAVLMGEIAASAFDTVSETAPALPPDLAVRYVQILRVGEARFGVGALGGGPSLVRTFILAGVAGDGQTQKNIVDLLKQAGPRRQPWWNILAIMSDKTLSSLTQLSRLHALGEPAAVSPFEQYMVSQLSAADRQSAEVLQIQVDDFLAADHLIEALPLLDRLAGDSSTHPTSKDARNLFWQAWANASTGNPTGAAAIFGKLQQSHPDDPWAKEAADVQPAIISLDSAVSRQVEAVLAAMRRIKVGLDELECQAAFAGPNGRKITGYLGIDSTKLLEMIFSRDGQPAVAYRATDQDGLLFVQGDPAMSHFGKPVVVPLPQFLIERSGIDVLMEPGLRFGLNFSELQASLANLTASEVVTTREGLQDVLHSFVRRGILPLPPRTQADGQIAYTWVNPQILTPDVKRVTFTLSADNLLTSVTTDGSAVTNIRYGPPGSFTPQPPPMPDMPVVEKGTMGITVVERAGNAVTALFNPPPATQPAATQP